MGFSAVAFAIIFACSHHWVDYCDEDAKCWSFTNMLECRERYFGNIHTPEYMEALRTGHNINNRIADPIVTKGRRPRFALSFKR